MTPLSDALTAARLTEDEHQRWQRLMQSGLSAETALAIVLRARESPPNGKDA